MAKLLRLPGLIDIHVHLRDLGEEEKEDFYTGTLAAIKGGVTTVFDMPNNKDPVFTYEKLREKANALDRKSVCDFGLYFGTNGKNVQEFEKVADQVVGLKIYLNATYGSLFFMDEDLVETVFRKWPAHKVITVHAEGKRVDLAIKLSGKYKKKTHVTHISTKKDLEKIIKAKADKLNITCDVAPQYLFLTSNDLKKLKGYGKVNPSLGKKEDEDFLWENISQIDCFATDHAPHTIAEKESSDPPSGIPGLETSLPLFLNAVNQGRLTIEDIIRKTNSNPRKIFGIDSDEETYVDVDMEEEYIIKNEDLHTKCGWSPFDGWTVKGRIKDVFIRGSKVFAGGNVLASPGFGKNVVE